ncbi:MAG: bifunctional pyr operon transcriptional regulator/uracil phosphoribosyltransferase PyrR [Flavobacteriaceae bacterium]|jgi:pyrimidine operon attenuation protein/uracil phosphoribosyltransferase
MANRILISEKKLEILLHRLCCQLIERHGDFSNAVLVGLQPRGIYLLAALKRMLESHYGIENLQCGKLDTTFFRDDFRRGAPLEANATEMEVKVENKSVVLIDDVLYTGRSIRAALTAIDSYGRPNNIELLVLIDRRFSRHLPIQPDYLGAQIDALEGEKVRVHWDEKAQKSKVYLEKHNA